MRTILYTFLVSVMIWSFSSCGDDETVNLDIDFGYEYFPLEVGQYRTYAADSIIYDLTGSGIVIDTHSFQVRDIIVDTTVDNENRVVYIVHHQERELDETEWQLRNVFTAVQTEIRAEWVENNHRFVKLLFPVQQDQTWNGNQFIDESEIIEIAGESVEMFKNWGYSVVSKGEAVNLNNLNFEDVVTTIQADDENLIERRFATEQYARGVGLIHRKLMILDTQCDGNLSNCTGVDWEEKAEKGFIYEMTLIDFN